MMFPRVYKKLALLLVSFILVIFVVIISKYLHTQHSIIDDRHDVKRKYLEDQDHGVARESDFKAIEKSEYKIWAAKQTQKSKHDSIQAAVMIDGEGDLKNMESEVAQDLMSRIKLDCRDKICTEFVSKADKPHFDYCIRKTWKSRSRYGEPEDSICRFIDGAGRSPIALASFPGSGNTWVRGLIQGITGLCTGAIYCDRTLRKTGFPGESIRSGIVLVVKTHHYDPRWTGVYYNRSAPFSYFKKAEHIPVYSSAIFILRNPFESFVSEFSRQLREEQPDSHVNLPKQEDFGTNADWNDFVLEQSLVWERTVLAWVANNHNHPVLIVRYEDLKNNTRTVVEMKRMLDFLQVPYSSSRLSEVVARGYSVYKRQHGEEFDHYTQDQRDTVRSAIERVAKSLEEHNLLKRANVSVYL